MANKYIVLKKRECEIHIQIQGWHMVLEGTYVLDPFWVASNQSHIYIWT